VGLIADISELEVPDNAGKQQADVYAALDLGSNSFHLLIARFEGKKLVVLDRYKESVRLASGLNEDGSLSGEVVARALDSLQRFATRLGSAGINYFRVVGTNTLRAASQTDDFLTRAEHILKAPIEIISGNEEGRLIFLGVAQDVAPGEKERLVIDIGGGSTEVVRGNASAREIESLYMGCVSFSQAFFASGKITAKAYDKAVLKARAEIQGVAAIFSSDNWDEALGASGTIRSVEAVLEGMGLTDDHMITRKGLDALAEKLCEFDHVDKINLPNLNEDRRAVFPGGLAVLQGLFIELDIQQMHVSSYALREGMIFDMAGRINSVDIRQSTVARMMDQYHVDQTHARRVIGFALQLFDQVADGFENPAWVKKMLVWSLSLHEIGLAIAHGGYHKHGAYLLDNSDMPGFSKQEQKLLGFLVLNHRRKLRSVPQTYGFKPDWRLVQIVRLACLFCRLRDDDSMPSTINLVFKDNALRLGLKKAWLAENPLTNENLMAEIKYLDDAKLKLDIKLL
jgi:exopolyphosphatase/guanosine-5'-triphosphate,3'-diphosphate pyrophosphatase